MVYTDCNGVKELVRWDFGYDGVETAACVALASILRDMFDVVETDYGVQHDLPAGYYYKPC